MRTKSRFSDAEREAVYRVIFERRDVRRNFVPTPIPDAVMMRLLTAAHHAGSVGFMQPWDFVVIRNRATKRAVKDLFIDANTKASTRYAGAKGELYRQLKLEGIEEAPVNLCITCSRRRGGPPSRSRRGCPGQETGGRGDAAPGRHDPGWRPEGC